MSVACPCWYTLAVGTVTGLRDRFSLLRRRIRDKATRLQRSLVMHGVTFAGINALLLGINAATGGVPWFLIPSAILGVGFALHAVRSSYRRTELQEQMTRLGLDWQKIEAGAATAAPSVPREVRSRRIVDSRTAR